MTTGRAIAGWIALGVTGLVVAVGVAYAASLFASPDIGLTSEPPSAALRVVPAPRPVMPRNVAPTRPLHTRPAPSADGDDSAGGDD